MWRNHDRNPCSLLRRFHLFCKIRGHSSGRWHLVSPSALAVVSAGMILFGGCSTVAPEFEPYPYVFLWREAKLRCVPAYPVSSVKSDHQGLSVVELDIRPDGAVAHFTVLQAPDDATRNSVGRCAAQFRAAPKPGGAAKTARRGKLFFYFVISAGRGEVYVVNDPVQKARLVLAQTKGRDRNPK